MIGALAPKLNGYGTWTDFAIGVGILVASLLLFIYRRVVEDREGVHLREDVPLVPDAAEMQALTGSRSAADAHADDPGRLRRLRHRRSGAGASGDARQGARRALIVTSVAPSPRRPAAVRSAPIRSNAREAPGRAAHRPRLPRWPGTDRHLHRGGRSRRRGAGRGGGRPADLIVVGATHCRRSAACSAARCPTRSRTTRAATC